MTKIAKFVKGFSTLYFMEIVKYIENKASVHNYLFCDSWKVLNFGVTPIGL